MKKTIFFSLILAFLHSSNSFSMLLAKRSHPLRIKTTPRKALQEYHNHKPGTIIVIDFDTKELIAGLTEANTEYEKVATRNDNIALLLKAQTSVAEEIINKHNQTIEILKNNTDKNRVEIPDIRPLYHLHRQLEKLLSDKE